MSPFIVLLVLGAVRTLDGRAKVATMRIKPPITPKFRRTHGTWPMTGYQWRLYGIRINRDAPFRHRNSCWSVMDPKRPCDCGCALFGQRRIK